MAANIWDKLNREDRLIIIKKTGAFGGTVNRSWDEMSDKVKARLEPELGTKPTSATKAATTTEKPTTTKAVTKEATPKVHKAPTKTEVNPTLQGTGDLDPVAEMEAEAKANNLLPPARINGLRSVDSVPEWKAVAMFGQWPKDDVKNPYRGQWFVAAMTGEILATHLVSETEAHKFIHDNFKGGEYTQIFNKAQQAILHSKPVEKVVALKNDEPLEEDEPVSTPKVHKKPASK